MIPIDEFWTDEQSRRYQQVIDALKQIERVSRDEDDPIVFHGTTLIRASHIVLDGFRAGYCQPGPNGHATGEHDGMGVHWGTLAAAENFAKRNATCDDPAVFLMIRVSDLLSQGRRLIPDWFAMTETGIPGAGRDIPLKECPDSGNVDWSRSLDACGALVMLGEGMVEGVRLINPFAGLPVHPFWERERAQRIVNAGSWPQLHPLPHPNWKEETAKTNPPSMSIAEAEERQEAMFRRLTTPAI